MNRTTNATEVRHIIGGAGSLSLRNVAGRVRLSGTDGEEVVVRCVGGRGDPPSLNVERSEGGLLVEPQRNRGRFFGLGLDVDGSLDFDVQLPRGARLDVKTVSADVDGESLLGEQNYKSVSGDVRLRGVAGRVSVMTVSGDVRLHEGGELALDGATTSGDFTVEASRLHMLGVRTVSGDIRLLARLEPGPRHAVETVSGDLHVESAGGVSVESTRALDIGRRDRQPVVVGDGSARLVFRTMSGDSTVTLGPAQAAPPATEARPAVPPAALAGELVGQDRLDVLRALERGEIGIEEASQRLEGMR